MPKAQNSPTAKRQNLSAGSEFWAGVREEVPLIFGVAPFGLVFGVLGIESGLTPLQTIYAVKHPVWRRQSNRVCPAMGGRCACLDRWRVGLRDQCAPCSLQRIGRRLFASPCRLRWRILLGYLLTDEAYAISIKAAPT